MVADSFRFLNGMADVAVVEISVDWGHLRDSVTHPRGADSVCGLNCTR